MNIEMPGDLAEFLADQLGVYGDKRCGDKRREVDPDDDHIEDCDCRVFWVPAMTDRIRKAVQAEDRWNRAVLEAAPSDYRRARGASPLPEGAEMPEETIRRLRDGEGQAARLPGPDAGLELRPEVVDRLERSLETPPGELISTEEMRKRLADEAAP